MPGVLDSGFSSQVLVLLGFSFQGAYIHTQKYCQGIIIIILQEIMFQKLEGILPILPHVLLLEGKGRQKQAKYQPHSQLDTDYIGEVTD